MAKKVYLAGPFFNDEQLERVDRLEKVLAAHPQIGDVFSPRKHQHDQFELFSPEWREAAFKSDVDAIDGADVMVALIDDHDQFVDAGTAWETGYASAKGVPVIMIKETAGSVNLMLAMSLKAYLTDIADVANYDFDKMPNMPYTGDTF
ncbi:nucleoside 2-deoxyribosyltransferase [Eupransor demetentiae]|uniref:Nucleoside 2-deoxyribosyltransferase (RCL) n=1 Tax=Eupransor demetentiae TaxID=3109584 RepID=A0ABM9N3S4_9LACO|nr:Nucleoside 2-deoxyribosyltransferase (RCL) [Lactobacillaceae bacterium LMG 33000]